MGPTTSPRRSAHRRPGSSKAPATFTGRTPPDTRSDNAGSRPTAAGGRFSTTVTRNVCAADLFEPLRSVAVTVTVDVPDHNGVTRTIEPTIETDATNASDDDAP